MPDIGTLVALGAMLISAFTAAIKFVDRRRQLSKENKELQKKEAVSEIERDSIVVRGAEGALLLMEKSMKTSNDQCQERINDLEEENDALKCEISTLRKEAAEDRLEIQELRAELKDLKRRINNG